MFLLDKEIFTGILRITCSILKYNFFYDDYCIARYINKFSRVMEKEYADFFQAADIELKTFLKYNDKAKQTFTSDFMCYHLHYIFVDYLFFSDQELDLFNIILTKILGVSHESIVNKSNERTHH